MILMCASFFFQAEDGMRDLVRSRGLGDVYKRQVVKLSCPDPFRRPAGLTVEAFADSLVEEFSQTCLLYTSDAADERSSVDLGGRRIIKKNTDAGSRRLGRAKRKSRQQRDDLYRNHR